jgi:hypothetical protein
MISKKVRLFFLVLMMLLALPVSAFANHDESGWQWAGRLTLSNYSSFWSSYYGATMYQSGRINSGGGNINICRDSSKSIGTYRLWEYDPGDGNDDYIGTYFLGTATWCKVVDVDAFTDGDNGDAEIYAVGTNKGAILHVDD